MKATDFMVGDWVLINGTPRKVQVVDGVGNEIVADDELYTLAEDRYHSEDKVEGVPLTPEILEKIGYEKFTSAMGREYYEIPMEADYIRLDTDFAGHIQGPNGNFEYKNIMFVHELQHAFRMLGIEKEIEL